MVYLSNNTAGERFIKVLDAYHFLADNSSKNLKTISTSWQTTAARILKQFPCKEKKKSLVHVSNDKAAERIIIINVG